MPADFSRSTELDLLHPIVRSAVQKTLKQLEQEKLPFRIFESYRSPQRQEALYAQGRSAPGDRVTKASAWYSYHQYGMAADFVLHIDGKWSWETSGPLRAHWERLHEIARSHGLEPLSWELPHLQFAGTDIKKLRAGDYPPFGDETWAANLAAAIAGWANRDPSAPPPFPISERPALPADTEDMGLESSETYGRTSPQVAGDNIREQPDQGLTEPIIRGAQASERVWGVPASVCLAQFILESARGKRMPPNSNNPFGIKARPGEEGVPAPTKEFRNGRMVTETARFRKFASFDEAFAKHGQLLATSHHYVTAMAVRHDPEAFCHALTGVYATDPRYGTSLVEIIRNYQLTQYDYAPRMSGSGQPGSLVTTGAARSAASGPALEMGASGPRVKAIQTALREARYPVGAIDGIFGRLTRDAILAFQADNNLDKTGIADAATLALIDKAPTRPLETKRQEASETDLKNRGSITMIEADRTRKLSWLPAILGLLGIGNSALVTAHGPSASTTVPADAASVGQLLGQVASVLNDPTLAGNTASLNGISTITSQIATSLRSGTPLDLTAVAAQMKQSIPSGILNGHPELSSLLATLSAPSALTSQMPRTLIDLLPASLVAPGGPLSAIASSIIPGFGGSVLALGVGLAVNFFANRTARARLMDHRNGSNLSR